MREPVIKIENVSKQYNLGAIGSTTLNKELKRWGARIRHREDPNKRIDHNGGQEAADGDSFLALENINLEVYKGERLGIIGRNGAGKSTLLKLLSRITTPTTGKISYNGRIASMLEIGTGFHMELTGRENIYLNGAILGMSRREIDSKIEQIIDFSECRQFIDTPIKRYSSGMNVKLAFSVAAFLDAEIIIMDEVLAVGDVAFQQKCLKRMRELAEQENRTILYVSHILSTVSQLCTRCIVMDHGRISYDGEVSEAITHYLNHEILTEPYIDYTKKPRKPQAGYDIQMLRAAFEGRNDIIFCDDEPIFLRLDVRYRKDCTGVAFQWELRTSEGRPAATSVLENFAPGKAGEEKSVLLKYVFPELMNGQYDSRFVFYYKMMDGSCVITEHVEGLSFEKKLNDPRVLQWRAAHWGNVKLPSPTVVSSVENSNE